MLKVKALEENEEKEENFQENSGMPMYTLDTWCSPVCSGYACTLALDWSVS